MSKLTKEAKGRECQVRLPCCNHNPETTVLAHYRLAGTCGVGIKPNDLQGAWRVLLVMTKSTAEQEYLKTNLLDWRMLRAL